MIRSDHVIKQKEYPSLLQGFCALCRDFNILHKVIGTTDTYSCYYYCENCIYEEMPKISEIYNCDKCKSFTVEPIRYPKDTTPEKQFLLCSFCLDQMEFKDRMEHHRRLLNQEFKKAFKKIDRLTKEVKKK